MVKKSDSIKHLSLFPFFNPATRGTKPPLDGSLIKTPSFCRSKFGATCTNFYTKIGDIADEKIFECPYGYTVYKFQQKGKAVFFSGMQVKRNYNHKKLKNGSRLDDLIITEREVQRGVIFHNSLQSTRTYVEEMSKKNGLLEQIVHEVRNYNSQLKSVSERENYEGENQPLKIFQKLLSNCFAISQMISSRLDYLTFKTNPAFFSQQRIDLYKKIDKAVRAMRSTLYLNDRKLKINFKGSSSGMILGFRFLEQVPAILIENAAKYSMDDTEIEISIDESNGLFSMEIENTGAFIHPEERESIFHKKVRGKEARKIFIGGTGLGLSFAQEVVNIHNGKISLTVGDPFKIDSNFYSQISFVVTLPITN